MTDFAASRQAMVDCQVRPSDVTKYAIIDAMLTTPREIFLPKAMRDIAYADTEVEMAPGRKLLEPRTIAKMLEAAQISPDDLVLDVAPGTGYTTALLSLLAAAVVSVEADEALSAQLRENVSSLDADNVIVVEDNSAKGDSSHGPYDVIFVAGAVEQVPSELAEQLKDGGRLVAIFRAENTGKCRVMVRAGDTFSQRFVFDADGPLVAGFEARREFAF
jgi:protein-L-isoaspartate(D-aspartate) O-methyltransferase